MPKTAYLAGTTTAYSNRPVLRGSPCIPIICPSTLGQGPSCARQVIEESNVGDKGLFWLVVGILGWLGIAVTVWYALSYRDKDSG